MEEEVAKWQLSIHLKNAHDFIQYYLCIVMNTRTQWNYLPYASWSRKNTSKAKKENSFDQISKQKITQGN